jgi:hypothetical protein
METLTHPSRPDRTGTGLGRLAEHRSVFVLVAVLIGVGLGGLAYLLIGGSEEDGASLRRPVRAGGSSASSSSGARAVSPSPTTAVSPGAGLRAVGRNPFGSGSAAGSAGTGTTTGSAPTAVTATVTVRVPVSVTYLGLYGWSSDGRPLFRVNETAATPSVGATFGAGLVYRGPYTSKSLKCANVTSGGSPRSLCEGEVIKLG